MQDDKTATMPIDMLSHIYWVCSRFFWGEIMLSFALQGLGDTLMPMVSGMAEFVMRISAALILPHFIGQDGIFFAEIAAWSGATMIL